MVRSLLLLLLALASVPMAALAAPDLDKWLGRSVYFVVTDRFARDDTSDASAAGGRGGVEFCGNGTKEWCGGTFKGVMSKLDYIAGMGFDAIWITPVVKQVTWRDNWNGTGYHGGRANKSNPGRRCLLLNAPLRVRAGYWAADFHEVDPHLGSEVRTHARASHTLSHTACCRRRTRDTHVPSSI